MFKKPNQSLFVWEKNNLISVYVLIWIKKASTFIESATVGQVYIPGFYVLTMYILVMY